MGTELQGSLRSLCLNTEWSYAVFWKLKHRARMVLTWEDAYYENCDPFENKCFKEALEKMSRGHYSHDPLGLAVAKMSYHVYSLGEGIVGQVAVTGKHRWIVTDEHITSSISSLEFSDGWQSQFSAGIKTVVVVAVVPYGVVQFGSFNKVAEDVNLVTHIRDLFSSIQDRSVAHATTPLQYNIKNPSYLPNLPSKGLEDSESTVITDSLSNLDKATVLGGTNYQLHALPCLSKHGNDSSYFSNALNLTNNDKFVGKKDPSGSGLESNLSPHFSDSTKGSISLCDILPSENFGTDIEQMEYQAEPSHLGGSNQFLKFSAGFELHEALGPAFSKGCLYSEAEKTEMPEVKSISDMTCGSGSENLLEAIVGSICYSGNSGSKSAQSLLTSAEKTLNSSNYSVNEKSFIQENAKRCSSGGPVSTKGLGFSSSCPSGCSEQLDRHSEPAKNSKKRARPGENGRPRPRDRQLIQDRIKELRELVPNGAKCSIDSLLERTIKHMLFMESITKHADKLNKCAESKMCPKGAETSNYEKGSSWAVEVGGHLKVSSIIVENLNKNGQMLVEMLCEECSHFLEIAEAIRSLGLTILKGITEMNGDKTWICFMVEGQNNRVMHRMDILWSLVQILQPKSSSN